jgi:hypothetical protein
VARAVKGATDVVERLIFRHDRIWDFFIMAAFASDENLWDAHLSDLRFPGAYFRIADTWPPEAAEQIRDLLSTSAAESGDHSTCDGFIKRLNKRLPPKKPRAKRKIA